MYVGITPSPDSGFVRQLRAFDRTLKVEFDRKIGLFTITQPRFTGGRVLAMVIESESFNGVYRQPDSRDLQVLRGADFYRRNYLQRMLDGEVQMREAREKQDADAAGDIRYLTLDNKRQLSNAYVKAFNIGKGNSGFRHITPKPRGQVFA